MSKTIKKSKSSSKTTDAKEKTTASAGAFAKSATKVTALVTQAQAMLALPQTMTTKQVKLATKFRSGGEPHVRSLASLSATYGVEVPTRPTADMLAQLQRAQDIAPLRQAVKAMYKAVNGAYFEANSETWATAVTLYGMLKKAGERNADLMDALAPTTAFFKAPAPTGRKRKSKSETASPDQATQAEQASTPESQTPAASGATVAPKPATPATVSSAS